MKRRRTIEDARPLLIVSGGHLLDPAVAVESLRKGDPGYQAPVELVERIGLAALSMGLEVVEVSEAGRLEPRVSYQGKAPDLEKNLAAAGYGYRVTTHAFSRFEHAVLSKWMGRIPAEAEECSNGDLRRFAGGRRKERLREAVAQIALRSVESALPNWACFTEENGLQEARKKFHHPDSRKLHLVTQHALTINWATSGPGFTWPNAYHVTWIPLYERYVVTVSADSEEGMSGYEDLALGHFGPVPDKMCSLKKIIAGEWERQREEESQERWEYIVEAGLVDEATAEAWADEVWEVEEDDYEEECQEEECEEV